VFDIHQSIRDEETGDSDETRQAAYLDGVMKEFAAAPEAQSIIKQFGRVGWVHTVLSYAFNHLGVSVPTMTLRDFNEVLFTLIPRKVSTEADSAPAIVAELRAFWSFVHRQYGLDNAERIRNSLTEEATHKLEEELSNPANFGMAKGFFMLGKEAGYDMTTQEGINAFMQVYNSAIQNRPGALADETWPEPYEQRSIEQPRHEDRRRHFEIIPPVIPTSQHKGGKNGNKRSGQRKERKHRRK
jgi:hypothetical protein